MVTTISHGAGGSVSTLVTLSAGYSPFPASNASTEPHGATSAPRLAAPISEALPWLSLSAAPAASSSQPHQHGTNHHQPAAAGGEHEVGQPSASPKSQEVDDILTMLMS